MQKIKQFGLIYELRIESLEDLWILSQFITTKNIITAKTERKIKIGGGENKKQIKKIIFIKLNVIKTQFIDQVLKIQGEILNETQFTATGQSHSLQFGIDDTIKIEKQKLLNFEKKLIENSFKNKKNLNLLILLDREELIATQFGSISYKILFEHKGLGSKKYTNEEINENEQKFNLIKELLKQKYDSIIIGGPGSYKESLAEYIRTKEKIPILTFKFTDVNTTSVQKAINEINKNGILKENSLAKETEEVKELLDNINKNTSYAYGLKEVSTKVQNGASKKILITTKYIEKTREDEIYSQIDSLLLATEQQGGTVTILNSKHESGNIIDGLGGIASILRY